MNYNLDPKLKCAKCQQNLPWLKCSPDFFRYFVVDGKDTNYCDGCLPHDLLEQRIEREHFTCCCKGGKLFNKCHDLRRNIRNNPLYWDNGSFKFECYYCGGKLGKNGEKIYECEEPCCERKFCSCSCQSRTLECRKPNHQTQNNQNSPNENFEQVQKDYRQVHEKAQSWWNTLSSSEREKELTRVVENMKLGKYWANNVKEGEASASTNDGFYMWIIKNGKFVSDTPHKVPIQIVEEFMEREFGKVDLALVLRRDYQIRKKDGNKNNSSPQSLTNSNVRSDNPISNSPKSIPELDRSSASSIKTIKFENKEDDGNNNYTDPVEKSSNKKLVINLRDIKQITLTPDGNLVIEFNKSENDNSEQVVQTVTDEQISINQELQIVKNYLQKNKQNSASQQELNNVLSANSTSTEKPEDNNSILLVVGIGGALTIGLLIGLFVRRKRNIKKN